jgi:Universal stress protein family
MEIQRIVCCVDDEPVVTEALLDRTAALAADLGVEAHVVRVIPPGDKPPGAALAAREELDRVVRSLWARGTPATSALVTDAEVARGIRRVAARPGTLAVLAGQAPAGRAQRLSPTDTVTSA